jgi:hypothetical protein
VGIYNRVERQIIEKAREKDIGLFVYSFEDTYEFGDVLFSLGESTVRGVFIGDSRIQEDYLIINGRIDYYFNDAFSDPLQLVEIIDKIPGVDREDAEDFISSFSDSAGTVYPITDSWQTKFNATLRLDDSIEEVN